MPILHNNQLCLTNLGNIIDDCDELSNEEKAEEKTKLLEARKDIFGSSFQNFPPWKHR